MNFNPGYGNTDSSNSGYTNASGEFVFKNIYKSFYDKELKSIVEAKLKAKVAEAKKKNLF